MSAGHVPLQCPPRAWSALESPAVSLRLRDGAQQGPELMSSRPQPRPTHLFIQVSLADPPQRLRFPLPSLSTQLWRVPCHLENPPLDTAGLDQDAS